MVVRGRAVPCRERSGGAVWIMGHSRKGAPEPNRHEAPRRGAERHGVRGIPEREPRTPATTRRTTEGRGGMGLGAFPKGSPEPKPTRTDVGRIVGGLWVDLWEDCGEIVG